MARGIEAVRYCAEWIDKECAGVETIEANRSQRKDIDIPSKHIAAHFISNWRRHSKSLTGRRIVPDE